MNSENNYQKITPEKAKMILNKSAMDVGIREAEKILEFLQLLANIQVTYFLSRK
jgi:transposase